MRSAAKPNGIYVQASCRCGTSFDVDRPPSGLDWLHVTVRGTKPKSRCRPGQRDRDRPRGEVAKVADLSRPAARFGSVSVGHRVISRPIAALVVLARGRSETL